MHKLIRTVLLICVGLLLVVGVRFGAAQTTDPATAADSGDYGAPTLPDREPVDPTAPPDDKERPTHHRLHPPNV